MACVLLNISRPLCKGIQVIAEVPSCVALMMSNVLKCNMHT